MPRADHPRSAARKLPRQERAMATVDAILEGAARVLIQLGWGKATTNRIAEAAGVSVGSLYQYFPSKDAIAVEMLKRYRERLLATVAAKLAGDAHVTFESAMGTLLHTLFAADGIDPALHRVLIEQVLRTTSRGEMHGFEDRLEAVVTAALEAVGPPVVRVADTKLAATVVVRSVLSLVHAVVVDRPGTDRHAMATEVTRMVTGYLAGK